MTTAAHAGGVGLLATGGAHTETLYYYQSVDDQGNPIDDPALYDQFKDPQLVANFGGGIEFLLGDRDDRIFGVTRFFYQQDAPQLDPTKDASNPDSVVVAYRDSARRVGIGTIGLSWGIVGNPNKFQFGVGTHIGSAFMTNDYSDYFLAAGGPMVTYRPTKQVMVFAEGLYTVRFRFDIQHQPTLNAGVRYFFD
jgi:hypothetical protein